MHQDSERFGLERFASVLRRRLPLIVLCAVIAGGATFAISSTQTKKYTANASIIFSDNSLSQQVAGLPVPAPTGNTLLAEEATNVALVQGGSIAAKTATSVGQGLTQRDVAESVSVTGKGESNVVVVSTTTRSPEISAEIANTYVNQFVKQQLKSKKRYFKNVLGIVEKQIAELSPQQRTSADGVELQNRAHTLAFLSELKEGNAKVGSQALPPTSPSSPRTKRDTALAVVLGLLIGLGVAFLLERFDHRIRRPADLEATYRLPLLGIVPKSAALSHSWRLRRKVRLAPRDAQSLSLICARLRFLNVEHELRTILVASPEDGDGKSTIAQHLAEAFASLGSKVLILEADLREPTLGRRLGLNEGPGLVDVLLGSVRIEDAAQPAELSSAPASQTLSLPLSVLTAGASLPPNPGELLAGQNMDSILSRARSDYDVVVIDSPSLTVFSDAFPLLEKVDGTLIVGRIGRSRRDAAERFQQVLAGSRAPLLGVIANGARAWPENVQTHADGVGGPPPPVSPGQLPRGDVSSAARS